MIDKELYRQAYAQMREWSAAKERERIERESQLSPAEAWRQFVGLWQLCMKLAPRDNDWQRREKLEALNRYYARVQKLEAWRRARGHST